MEQIMVKIVERKSGITRSVEFQKKTLATHALNVGDMCGHGCLYCSTPAIRRTQPNLFSDFGGSSFKAFAAGEAIVDPATPERLSRDLAKLTPADTVMMCTLTDAWSPEAQEHGLGRRCLERLLNESNANVRVLTKNAAIIKDMDLLAGHRDRVTLSLSITAPSSKAYLLDILEPKASPLAERMDALRAAHEAGIPVFGMLCPCLPGVADSPNDLEEMLDMVKPFAPTAVWAEPVNPRGQGLILCQEALAAAGHYGVANEIRFIRGRREHADYTSRLIENLNAATSKMGMRHLLKILVYADGKSFAGDSRSVIWLK
jgi:DNA repair photolyase